MLQKTSTSDGGTSKPLTERMHYVKQHHLHPLYSFSSLAVNRYTLQKQKSSPQWPASHRHGRALISHSDCLQPTVSIHSNPAALTVVGGRPHLYSRLLPFAPVTHFYMEIINQPRNDGRLSRPCWLATADGFSLTVLTAIFQVNRCTVY